MVEENNKVIDISKDKKLLKLNNDLVGIKESILDLSKSQGELTNKIINYIDKKYPDYNSEKYTGFTINNTRKTITFKED